MSLATGNLLELPLAATSRKPAAPSIPLAPAATADVTASTVAPVTLPSGAPVPVPVPVPAAAPFAAIVPTAVPGPAAAAAPVPAAVPFPVAVLAPAPAHAHTLIAPFTPVPDHSSSSVIIWRGHRISPADMTKLKSLAVRQPAGAKSKMSTIYKELIDNLANDPTHHPTSEPLPIVNDSAPTGRGRGRARVRGHGRCGEAQGAQAQAQAQDAVCARTRAQY
jgi:hypothetical protein